MPSNRAAYLHAPGAALVISESPYPETLAPDDVLVHTRAVAINPADSMVQEVGLFIEKWPHVLGCDVAGTVVSTGSNVSHVQPGDRVLGLSSPGLEGLDGAREQEGKMPVGKFKEKIGAGAFQEYCVVDAHHMAKIPENLGFAEAAVLPLCVGTSSTGLYSEACLGLELPKIGTTVGDEYVLVWGGASSVGSNGIQLARGSGYRVITTSSVGNAEYCERELGAEKAFDYKSENVVDEIVSYLEGKHLVGVLDAIARGTTDTCVVIARKVDGEKKVCTVAPGAEKGHGEGVNVTACVTPLADDKAKAIYEDFLPKALETGQFKAKPDPFIVGPGLESVQKALETFRESAASSGVGGSSRKLVVTL